jgi:hypothetical protein
MRAAARALLIASIGAAACAVEVSHDVDLQHANARSSFQTAPEAVLVLESDVDQPYDVLGDLEVVLRQRGSLGELPTRAQAIDALRQQAGLIGAHAVILVAFGEVGMSWWSYNELHGHGRAVRFR